MHSFDSHQIPALDLHLVSPESNANGGAESPTLAALQRFLPSNNEDSWSQEHLYACDEFRMFEFKVRRCMRGRSHDWTECPFAHPGEKARRRDPRRFHYSGSACPDFRKGCCRNGDACDLAHGVFECWLHPARYRTQPCKDGRACRRKVCFFAHTPQQLRLPPGAAAAAAGAASVSPPMSPMSEPGSPTPPGTPRGAFRDALHSGRYAAMPHGTMRHLGQSHSFGSRGNVGALVAALQRQLEINEAAAAAAAAAAAGVGGGGYSGFSSYLSPPASPYARSPLFRSSSEVGFGGGMPLEPEFEAPPRVESGRDLRAKVYGKIMRDNLLECGEVPDLAWVNELVAIN